MSTTLQISVILGTARQGRQSEHVARLVFALLEKRAGVVAEFIDVREIPMRLDDAGESMKDPKFADSMQRSDALVLVVPEYNHGYPGLLKHALDMCLEEYNHKVAGICGVSAGPFGGARAIENLVPVLRELGLVTSGVDVNFSKVHSVFNEQGELQDESWNGRVNKFLDELIWLARVMKHGRANIAPA